MLVGNKEPIQLRKSWHFVALFILGERPRPAIPLSADTVRWHSWRWWKQLICSLRLPVTHAIPWSCLSLLPQTFGVPGHATLPVSITPARPTAWKFIWLKMHLFSSPNHHSLVGSYFSITRCLSGVRNPLDWRDFEFLLGESFLFKAHHNQ